MILQLENTVTHKQYEYDVKDNNEGKKLYYQFDINTLNLDDGEYKLTLIDGKKVVVNDILKIGDFNPNSLQYNKGENTYVHTELNAKIQSKNVEISDVSTSIYPDDEFDAMTSVNVDAQPLYNTAYNSGEADGYDKGYVDGRTLTEIGYDEKESEQIVNKILISPSVDVYKNWDENNTNATALFYDNTDLVVCPNLNLSNAKHIDGLFAGCSSLKYIPDILPKHSVREMYGLFSGCTALEVIPPINTSAAYNPAYMFYNCQSLKEVPSLDLHSVVYTCMEMYENCSNLKRVGEFSAPNTTSVECMFSGCTNLESIGSYEHYLDLGSCNNSSYMFSGCLKLKELPIINYPKITTESAFFGSVGNLVDLVEVGGCISKHNQNGTNKWARCPNLSQASLQRIINCLYDYVGNGSSTTKGIAFHSNSKALITDEMTAQAAAKGWSIVYK